MFDAIARPWLPAKLSVSFSCATLAVKDLAMAVRMAPVLWKMSRSAMATGFWFLEWQWCPGR